MDKHVSPSFKATSYNCPHCGAFAQQNWFKSYIIDGNYSEQRLLMFCFCKHCDKNTLWHKGKMIFPSAGNVSMPNSDLPQDIIDDYNEAREIINNSPRGAAALLRLAIQKLCMHLGEKGNNINADIAKLVKKGLPPKIQQALDIVRVIGNNAVHPGQIDLKDDQESAAHLFGLINIIADVMISQPKHIDSLYGNLPQSQQEAISKRDKE